MAKAIRSFVVVIVIFSSVLFTGCRGEFRSTPGVYVPVLDSYVLFDMTVLTGEQVHHALRRFNDTLTIVVIKGDKGYVQGQLDKTAYTLGELIPIEKADLVNIIEENSYYQCYVLRDMNNEVYGIKLTEQNREKVHG